MADGALPDAQTWQEMDPDAKQAHATDLLESVGPMIDQFNDMTVIQLRELLETETDPTKRDAMEIVLSIKEDEEGL